MPYIKVEERIPINAAIATLIEHVKSLEIEKQDGALNYAITKIIKDVYPKRYFHLNRCMGMLESVKQEFYRVVVQPYEIEKAIDNGNVK